jgi:hypothetical protein
MKASIPDFELPEGRFEERALPVVSSEDNLRWRLAKHAWRKPVPREPTLGEPFVWIEKPNPHYTSEEHVLPP